MRKTVTIAVPLYNEDKVVCEMVNRLDRVLSELAAKGVDATVLFVDDGSSDQTAIHIKGLHRQDSRFGYLELSRNFGHQAAISAALDHIDTDAVIIIDGDLQD